MKGLKQCCSMLQVIMSQVTPYPLTILEPLIKPTVFFKMDTYTENYHPLPQVPDHSCVSATVLPSTKKDRVLQGHYFL